MALTPTTLVSCPDIQAKLNDIYDAEPAKFYRDPIPFTEYLMSPINRNDLGVTVSPGDAHIRTAQLTYQPRILQSDVGTDEAAYCTASTKRGTTSTSISIDTSENRFLEQSFDVNDLEAACLNNGQWIEEQVLRMVAAMDTAVNIKNATQASALLGGWSTDVSGVDFVTLNAGVLEVQTLQPSSTFAPFPQTMQSVQAAAMSSNFGQTAIFGGFQFHNYMKMNENGCCANYGLDIGAIQAQYGMSSTYDRDVSTAAGGAAFAWAISNGALQVIDYNRWAGAFELKDANSNYGTIQSPRTGMKYDLVLKHDCGVISVTLTASTTLVALPTDMYQTGDHLDGVNGFAPIQVVNV